MKYFAYTYTDKVGQIDAFGTEAELDEFAKEMTSFSDEEQEERRAEGNDYGPPIVYVFTAEDWDAEEKKNYIAPFAIYLRGERWDCVKREQ